MQYSEAIKLIKHSTLQELKDALQEMYYKGLCRRATGSTRTTYIFSMFVIKVGEDYINRREYTNYTLYITKSNSAVPPITRTRQYKTADDRIVLVQEKVTDIIDDFSSEFNCHGSRDDVPEEVAYLEGSVIVDYDGYQMGRNKRGMYVFFDCPLRFGT